MPNVYHLEWTTVGDDKKTDIKVYHTLDDVNTHYDQVLQRWVTRL